MKNLFFFLFIFFGINIYAQSPGLPLKSGTVNICNTSEAMKALLASDPKSKTENDNFELFTSQFVKQQGAAKTLTAVCYIIPVVFHVYGTTQSGKPVNNSIIINALNNVNKDFQGLNNDYNTVHNSFSAIRGTMPDINFALAQLDPNGNTTSGIVYHPVAAGYGNANGYDAAIATDAWDNYKYMNIYIMNDLYNNAVYNNSGIAWYPNTSMSNNNTARIVYNGAYLGTNTNAEFASVLTHEFGHWMNLIHTFEGGCVSPNDNVNDTPPCNYSGASYTCHASPTSTYPVNCNATLINAENYMDYSGATGCYKMFTQGQVSRMYAALLHPARQTLWQTTNLDATGLNHLCLTTELGNYSLSENFNFYPNPSNDIINIHVNSNLLNSNYFIYDELGREILSGKLISEKTTVNISTLTRGIYFLKIGGEYKTGSVKKLIKH